ncbi:MAG: HesA/MoeB/ThiF family protein [Spirochaetaceae bacterium]|nr:MAG: HesA/MoeB/ThiF family protein [Spirochaetaceae bacterium]
MTATNDRYARHRPLLSDQGMRRLRSARVLLVGAGGLGCNVAMLLVRLGIATLIIRDPGVIDAPDLNRQVLYTPADLGRPKVEVARQRLHEINPDVELEVRQERITGSSRLPHADICFDCLDSFGARAALEAALQNAAEGSRTAGREAGDQNAAAAGGLPLIHGGAEGWFGQVSTLAPGGGGYRAVFGPGFDERAHQEAEGKPIMPHVVALVAAAQVAEFVRWCDAGTGAMLVGRILVIDGMHQQHEIITLQS